MAVSPNERVRRDTQKGAITMTPRDEIHGRRASSSAVAQGGPYKANCAFIMLQTELLFEFQVISFNQLACFDRIDQASRGRKH